MLPILLPSMPPTAAQPAVASRRVMFELFLVSRLQVTPPMPAPSRVPVCALFAQPVVMIRAVATQAARAFFLNIGGAP
ncbi:hypothetical protein D9M70_637460 [compost metagenome]